MCQGCIELDDAMHIEMKPIKRAVTKHTSPIIVINLIFVDVFLDIFGCLEICG